MAQNEQTMEEHSTLEQQSQERLDQGSYRSCDPMNGFVCKLGLGGSVAEWLACWTQAQKGLMGSNRSRDAVG